MPAPDEPTPEPMRGGRTIPIWTGAIAVLAAVAFGVGGLISAVDPALLSGGTTGGDGVYIDYTVSRDLALAVVILCMLAVRAQHVLSALLLLAALIQIADLIQDAAHGRTILVSGIGVLAVLFLAAGTRLADTHHDPINPLRSRSRIGRSGPLS